MDVRCDRCQTEYELEDDSVAEHGASVQCTTCGHTFVVSRSTGPMRTPTPGPTAEMSAPAWSLTTEEGGRPIASAIRRRCRSGLSSGAWAGTIASPRRRPARRLGDMDELRPFFDLVDQADRGFGFRVARPTQPETPQRLSAGARGYSTPDEDDDDVLMGGRRSRGGGQRGRGGSGAGSTPTSRRASPPWVSTTALASCCPSGSSARCLARALVLAALAVGAWFLGSKSGASKLTGPAPPRRRPWCTPPMPPRPRRHPSVTPTPPPRPPPAAATPPAATAPAVAARRFQDPAADDVARSRCRRPGSRLARPAPPSPRSAAAATNSSSPKRTARSSTATPPRRRRRSTRRCGSAERRRRRDQ